MILRTWRSTSPTGGSHIKQTFLTFFSFRIYCCVKMFPLVTAYFVLFKLVSIATAAPVETTSVNQVTETADCNNENSDVYDQRQNGTENYRIHVNGVVVLVAPAETVLQAAQLGSLQMGVVPEHSVTQPLQPVQPSQPSQPSQPLKPKPKPTTTDKVPHESHATETPVTHPKDSKDKNNLKLLNLLHMFRSLRHDAEGIVHDGNK